MLKRNKISIALLATSVVVSASAFAEESVSSTATVTVQNAFDFAETAPLTFGTLTVTKATGTYDAATVPTLIINPDGTLSEGTSDADTGGSIKRIVDGSPASFEVANAASFTDLTITLPADSAAELTNPSAPNDNGKFTLLAFKALKDGETTAVTTDGLIGTDLNGSAVFTVGATLKIEGNKDYIDGEYVGNYTVKIAY